MLSNQLRAATRTPVRRSQAARGEWYLRAPVQGAHGDILDVLEQQPMISEQHTSIVPQVQWIGRRPMTWLGTCLVGLSLMYPARGADAPDKGPPKEQLTLPQAIQMCITQNFRILAGAE